MIDTKDMGNSTVITVPTQALGLTDIEKCIEELSKSEARAKTALLDFATVQQISPEAVQHLSTYIKGQPQKGRRITILSSSNLANMLIAAHLDRLVQIIVRPRSKVIRARDQVLPGQPADTMKIFINNFLQVLSEHLEKMIGVPFSLEPPFIRSTRSFEPSYIFSVQKVTAGTFSGCFRLLLSEKMFRTSSEKMFKTNDQQAQDRTKDWIAEVLNISMSRTKDSVAAKQIPVTAEIPTCHLVSDASAPAFEGESVAVIFKSDIGDMLLEVHPFAGPLKG